MRLSQAFRVFFRVLGDDAFAQRVAAAENASTPAPTATPQRGAQVSTPTAPTPTPRRSEAITLLAVLQREGRLVDFLQEPIDAYPDAQVGSAVREIHRETRQALERIFGLVPAVTTVEGGTHRVPAGYDPARIRLTGQVAGAPPHQGTVVHPGWEATRCTLPEWTGGDDAVRIVAPAEVEIR
jgi:hypothetical protein